MKIMVIGGTGFIGEALVKAFAQDGHEVFMLGRKLFQGRLYGNVHFFSATLDNAPLMRELLCEMDYVFHAASDTTPGASKANPALEAVNNILPSLRFLEEMHANSGAHLVYLSSGGAIYPSTVNTLLKEKQELCPLSYYGAGKASIEAFLNAYAQQTGKNVTIMRPSNVYGPGQKNKSGFGVVPTIFNKIESGESFEIWGDGTAVRDYIFIEDLVGFALMIVEKPTIGYEVFNVGSGVGTTVMQLIKLLETITSKEIDIKMLPERGVDISSVVLDVSKASQIGWSAKTDLSLGLKKTWQAFKEIE